MRRNLFIVLGAILLSACATTHSGKKTTSLNGVHPVVVSAETIGKVEGAFQMVEVTFENTSDDWFRVNDVEVIIPPNEQKLSIVVGDDLVAWSSAMEAKGKMERYNQDIISLGLIASGFLASIIGDVADSDALRLAGSSAQIAGSGAMLANKISRAKNYATRVKLVPDTHLQHAFSVPAGLPIKRWILFNKPSDAYLKTLAFNVETVDGKKDTYEVPLMP